MPFDTTLLAPRLDPLAEALDRRNIMPVDPATLAAHKQAQLERFGPSFWYRHQGMLLLGLLVPFLGIAAASGLAQGMRPFSASLPCFLSLGWMCLIPLLFVSGLFRLRSGSHWEERWVSTTALDRLGVPEPIALLARELRRDVPGAALILGELVQDRAVLDPYLLLVRGRERICLGIWDGGKIVAKAG